MINPVEYNLTPEDVFLEMRIFWWRNQYKYGKPSADNPHFNTFVDDFERHLECKFKKGDND